MKKSRCFTVFFTPLLSSSVFSSDQRKEVLLLFAFLSFCVMLNNEGFVSMKGAVFMSLYSGYIRQPHYYEEARVELLAFLDLPYHTIEEAGLIVPVLEVSAQYKTMIRYEDEVRIDVLVDKYTGTRLDFRYEIYKTSDGQLATTGTSKHCFLAKETNRIVQLKRSFPEIHQRFADYAALSGE
jgi:acyl-CoA thioester hydrolase